MQSDLSKFRAFFIKWLLNTAALCIVVWIVPGITAVRLDSLALTSLILGFLNTFIRPVLVAITLPLQIFTLGFFTLLINGFLFLLAGRMVDGFIIEGFWSAFWGAVFFSVASFLLNLFILPGGVAHFHFQSYREQAKGGSDVIDIDAKVSDPAEKDKGEE